MIAAEAQSGVTRQPPPRVCVAIAEVVVDGGVGRGAPCAVQVDVSMEGGVQPLSESVRPAGGEDLRGEE